MKLDVVLDSHICFNYVKLRKLNRACWRTLKHRFTYKNPTYISNEKMGFNNSPTKKNPKGTPEFLYSFTLRKKSRTAKVERGCYLRFKKHLKEYGITINLFDQRLSFEKVDFGCNIVLKKEQKPMVKRMLKKTCGVFLAPPSAGKTPMTLKVIADTGQVSTVAVHTTTIQKQWIKEVKKFYNISSKDIGGCGGVFKNPKIGKINICMIHSLAKKKIRKIFADVSGGFYFDEGQKAGAETFNAGASSFPAKYRETVTASIKRKDGKSFLVTDCFGPIMFSMKDEEIASRMKAKITLIPTNFYYGRFNWNRNNAELLNAMARDKARNKIIVKRALRKIKKKKLILILVERKEQAVRLKYALRKYRVKLLLGKQGGKAASKKHTIEDKTWAQRYEREMFDYDADKEEELIYKLGAVKKLDVIIGTKKADVGLSIRTIDHLIICTPTGGNLERFNQQKGRPERSYGDDKDLILRFGEKEKPTVDYIYDYKMSHLKRHGENIKFNYKGVNTLRTKNS